MDENSKKYTAFLTPEGHFHFNRMSFVLENAPAPFQRMMDLALRGLIGKICFVYQDDIVVFGRTLKEHNENLITLFERLRATNLKLQPDKREFLRPELKYLGHLITENIIKPNQNKLDAVKNFKKPINAKDVRDFLGLEGYYRKFIEYFSSIAKPLTDLTKKNHPFDWSPKCEKALKDQKLSLFSTSAQVSRLPRTKHKTGWDQNLNLVCLAFNAAVHQSTG